MAINFVGKLHLVLLIGLTLFPVPLCFDIRGWAEMHPLNGPARWLTHRFLPASEKRKGDPYQSAIDLATD